MDIKELREILLKNESEHLEFKEAKNSFSFLGNDDGKINRNSALAYCVALGNEGGGKLILGISDKKPRQIIGTKAIENIGKTKSILFQKLGRRVKIEEIFDEKENRILIFHIPSRPVGQVFRFHGIPLMRVNEELREMDDETLLRILNENEPDFSAEICKKLAFQDFDQKALKKLREAWSKKSGKPEYLKLSFAEILKKLLLMRDGELTFAALLLCGKSEKIAEFLPEAEVRFGWRIEPKKLNFDFTKNWRAPFLLIEQEIWEMINARNIREPFEEGFFEFDIWAFGEKSIREAVLNAFAHRNYRVRGSISIEISPESFAIESPGRFLPGVSPQNALDVEGKWRNRLLMETLDTLGFVERRGFGLDRIFSRSIREGKGFPKLSETEFGFVRLEIAARVKDKKFIAFLQKIAAKKQISFGDELSRDLFFLEEIRTCQNSKDLARKTKFLDLEILEKSGHKRGTKYFLSKKFYDFLEKSGEYTRKKWLSRSQQRELLWQFFKDHKKGQMRDFRDGLFENRLNNRQINYLLDELRQENKIYFAGQPKSPKAFWEINPRQ
ncbi:MAG: ATP-binding protein [Patescibacteria group bacterium]